MAAHRMLIERRPCAARNRQKEGEQGRRFDGPASLFRIHRVSQLIPNPCSSRYCLICRRTGSSSLPAMISDQVLAILPRVRSLM